MTEDRPQEIRRTPVMKRYRLWFPADTDDAVYDRVEVMSFETEADMMEAFESDAADRVLEADIDVINFDNEGSMMVYQELDLDVSN